MATQEITLHSSLIYPIEAPNLVQTTLLAYLLNYRVFCIWYVKCSAAATHRPVWQYSQLPNLFSECLQLFFNFWLVYVASPKVKFGTTTTAIATRETIVIIVKIITKCVSFQERKNERINIKCYELQKRHSQKFKDLWKRGTGGRGERERKRGEGEARQLNVSCLGKQFNGNENCKFCRTA